MLSLDDIKRLRSGTILYRPLKHQSIIHPYFVFISTNGNDMYGFFGKTPEEVEELYKRRIEMGERLYTDYYPLIWTVCTYPDPEGFKERNTFEIYKILETKNG